MTIYEENVLYDLTQIYSKLKKKKKLTNFKKSLFSYQNY